MSTCMNTPPQTCTGTLNIRSSVPVFQARHCRTHSLPAPSTTRELPKTALPPGRQDLAPSMKEGGKMCAWLNHWYCRGGPGANNKLQLSLYHLMWLAAGWVGPKLRIVEVTPNRPILQINEVHISKNLRAVSLCWVTNYFSFLVLYYSYWSSCRLKNS